MVSTLSVDTIQEIFPFVTIPHQTGTPTYEPINTVHQKFKAKALLIPSECSGTHGLLEILLYNQTYMQKLTREAAFLHPAKPSTTAVIIEWSAAAQISTAVCNQDVQPCVCFKETT